MAKSTIKIQMLLRMLFVILVGFAFCKSFQVTSSIKAHNHWAELKEQEGAQKAALRSSDSSQVTQLRKQLAETIWQENDFAETEKLLTDTSSLSEQKGYDAHFVDNTLALASLNLDAGALTKAINLYQSILGYDRKNIGDSCREVARDLNCLGVTSYLAGQTSEEPDQRKAYFTQACDYYSQAAEITRRLGDNPENSWRLKRILSNRELAVRDLNKANQAPFDRHKSPNNQMI